VATNAAPSSSGPAIFAVFKTIPGLCHKQTGSTLVDPETYLAASGQAIFLTIAMAWTIAYIWNPAIIESNPPLVARKSAAEGPHRLQQPMRGLGCSARAVRRRS